MKALKIIDLTFPWGSKDMAEAGYVKGQKVWVPREFGRNRNPWGALDRRDYRLEITTWLYSDGALCPDVTIFSHAGTHVESPGFHMVNPPERLKEKGVADYPPERYFGEAAVIDLTPFAEKAGIKGPPPDFTHYLPSLYQADRKLGKGTASLQDRQHVQVSGEDLHMYDKRVRKGDILLVFNNIGRGLIFIDATWIIEKGVKMVGMQNVWFYGEKDGITNAHDVLLSNNVLLIEGLRNIDKLAKERVFFIGMPWKLLGVGASPIWAIAIEEWDYTPMNP